LIKLLV